MRAALVFVCGAVLVAGILCTDKDDGRKVFSARGTSAVSEVSQAAPAVSSPCDTTEVIVELTRNGDVLRGFSAQLRSTLYMGTLKAGLERLGLVSVDDEDTLDVENSRGAVGATPHDRRTLRLAQASDAQSREDDSEDSFADDIESIATKLQSLRNYGDTFTSYPIGGAVFVHRLDYHDMFTPEWERETKPRPRDQLECASLPQGSEVAAERTCLPSDMRAASLHSYLASKGMAGVLCVVGRTYEGPHKVHDSVTIEYNDGYTVGVSLEESGEHTLASAEETARRGHRMETSEVYLGVAIPSAKRALDQLADRYFVSESEARSRKVLSLDAGSALHGDMSDEMARRAELLREEEEARAGMMNLRTGR